MRTARIFIAVVLNALALPAGIRADRASQGGSLRRMPWEGACCLLAIIAATAILITALRG